MNFRPLHDRVLVRRVESDEKTPGGIIIPDTAQEKPMEGEVLEVGSGARDENGKLVPNEKEFVILQSMFHLRKSGLGYRKISDEIKKKFGRRIHFPQVHKILNRPHNQQILEVA